MQSKELRCPRDASALLEAPEHQCRAHACGQCHGVFIDQDKVSGLRSHAAWHRNVRPPAGQAYLHCPHDGDKLVPFHFKGVEVDVCFTCFGAWLDKDELQKVSAFVAPRRKAEKTQEGWSADQALEAADIVEFVMDFFSSID